MPTTVELLAAAVADQQAGRLQEAVQICRQIVERDAACPEAWKILGLSVLNQPDYAEQCFNQALQLRPDYAEARYYLGLLHHKSQRLEEAAGCYRAVLALQKQVPEAHFNLGAIYHVWKRFDEAAACYRRAIELRPNYALAYNNLGNVLHDQWAIEEAVRCYTQALAIDPTYAEAHCNLGSALTDQAKWQEALASLQRAIAVKPDYAEALNNLGIVHQKLGMVQDAMAFYKHALAIKPDYAEALTNRAMLLLLLGDFAHGWADYEWRWKKAQSAVRDYGDALWSGEALEGKSILLHAEQGLGDTIQFIRYAGLIKDQGAKVIFECPKSLLRILERCPGIDLMVPEGDELPEYDFHAPLLSLPRVFKTSITTIPASVPYLFADETRVAEWRATLQDVRGFRIGINWRGREGHAVAAERDIPVNLLASLSAVPGVRLISLQKRVDANSAIILQQYDVVNPGPIDASHGAFMDTAAIMKNIDLVITSDTSIPHVAGALGVPVWVALPFVPDWRWLLNRADSPWYPTMRLFRQAKPGDWESVFEEIRSSLQYATRSAT